MTCRVSTDWNYSGFDAITMENDKVRTTILPGYGAKVFQFVLKETGKDMLYHNPRVEVRQPVFGVNADNWWHGGIDECIPTGAPCRYKGEDYPYLGEVWSLPWNYAVEKESADESSVHLWRQTVILPLLVERWVTLKDGLSILENRHRITNVGTDDVDFIWGVHPGIAISETSRIDIPQSEVLIDESSPNDRLGPKGTTYSWPYAKTREGERVDMRRVGARRDRTVDMHYAIGFKEGWLSVTETSNGTGIGLVFPTSIFKAIWLWLVYGGWRGLYCAAVEAWTGYPSALDQAVKAGEYSVLRADKTLECETKVVGYSKFRSVTRIRDNGIVEGTPL